MSNRTQSLHRLMIIGGVRCVSEDKIRCYPAYTLDDGSLVWRSEESGEQFCRFKVDNNFYFVSVFGGENGQV